MTKKLRDLPKDLVEEILCRVPAKNLKRLRPTCKLWNRLFRGDNRFARKHFGKAAKEFEAVMITKDYMLCPMRINLHRTVPSVEVKSELRLVDPRSNDTGAQFEISRVFHCEGLLLCTFDDDCRIVVWNPCTGETWWIYIGFLRERGRTFVLGYSLDRKSSCSKSYKILSYYSSGNNSEIYEFSSDSWRTLDYDIAPGWSTAYSDHCVSLKGSTYVFGRNETGNHLGLSLLRFDFSTEQFVPVPLPRNWPGYVATSLSVVKEEKISVLLQRHYTSKAEIWLTNKIDETKAAVSWNKVLALDLSSWPTQISESVTFLLDEEKKVVVLCEVWVYEEDKCKDMVYIVGEDNRVTHVNLGEDTMDLGWPTIHNYVPSLAQIDGARCK